MDDEASFNNTVGAVLPEVEERGPFHFFRRAKEKKSKDDAPAPTKNLLINVPNHDTKPRQNRTLIYHETKKPGGGRRRCLSPEKRRQQTSSIFNGEITAVSAPGYLHTQEPDNSVKSAPTAVLIDMKKTTRLLRDKYNRAHSMRNISSTPIMPASSLANGRRGQSISMRDLTGDVTVGASLTSQDLLCRRKSDSLKSAVKVPSGSITIVVTDVQNSTGLWEKDPSAMKEALNLHDAIIRKCYFKHSGYEITTGKFGGRLVTNCFKVGTHDLLLYFLVEGDSFQIAFQHPLDALSFCFQAQIDLYDANWSDDILSLKDAKLDKGKTFRGLRVRMGLHHGPTTSHIHEITLRIFYKGEALDVAKTVSQAARGGMILTTLETWRSVSGMAERYLGSPQVIDCGTHILDGERPHSLVQLVAKKQAFDYFYWRGRSGDQHRKERREGRRFSLISSIKQVSASFFDAPYSGNVVTLVFAYTVDMIDDLSEGAKLKNNATLAKILRNQLNSSDHQGYECQEDGGNWMLAFHSVSGAVTFGTAIVESIKDAPINVKVGIHTGSFTSMGPHAVTGRADYFGPGEYSSICGFLHL